MEEFQFKVISHNSLEYVAEVALRHSILRQPLGLAFSAEQLLVEADSCHIGCYVDGEIVGCLVLKPVDVGDVQMRQVAVAESMQGKGVGRLMVKYSEALAKTQGFRKVVLHARETAVPFYELLGYTKVGNRFMEITLPHWAMEKVL
jgi:N-acetylglutamate synthase-like GNAT family acetyltransferase